MDTRTHTFLFDNLAGKRALLRHLGVPEAEIDDEPQIGIHNYSWDDHDGTFASIHYKGRTWTGLCGNGFAIIHDTFGQIALSLPSGQICKDCCKGYLGLPPYDGERVK
ncbi:MAG TPA: hypothetical protein VMW24_24715 [Sedimentisphaerales bacterium]|nr:hypothetical protein [Sedimentisphaerales bacterium]